MSLKINKGWRLYFEYFPKKPTSNSVTNISEHVIQTTLPGVSTVPLGLYCKNKTVTFAPVLECMLLYLNVCELLHLCL